MAAMSDYLENALIDFLFRGAAAPTIPGTIYFALYTTDPTDANVGTEVSASGYARVALACSLADWAGTQGTGTTTASSGTNGTTSNNVSITFPAPGSAAWGSIGYFGVLDAATGGNLLWHGALTSAKTVNANDAAPSWAAGTLSFQIDN